MSTSRINKVIDKPLSREEIDARMRKMMEDRQAEDVERRKELGVHIPDRIMPIKEKPLTREEINERMQQMLNERMKQDNAVRIEGPRGCWW